MAFPLDFQLHRSVNTVKKMLRWTKGAKPGKKSYHKNEKLTLLKW
jgi:hypothetical protein